MVKIASGKAVFLIWAGIALGSIGTLALAGPANLAATTPETGARISAAPADQAVLPSAEIASRLVRRGYALSEPMIRRGPTYMATGIDGHGRRLRIVIDGRNAEIIGMRRVDIDRPRPHGADPKAPAAAAPQR
ncbi:MAG: hypothetical protein J0H01_05430 [Rhizobiales bacterium]|nr:hypothetical protein [Hyphomicrobiales bacterium]